MYPIMKWNIITHNIRGLNDPESISKERCFINSLTPQVDVVMIQEHKLRGKALENLGSKLMPGCVSWILEAAPGERSWINPNAAGKGGVGILLSHKYAKLVTEHGSLYENRVVWVKLDGIEGGSLGLACIYAPNIPTDRRHLWHIIGESLPKDCKWLFGGDFNMTERPQDKSNDCGRAISDLERFTWNEFLNAFQVKDKFTYQGGPRFSWCNGQKGQARRLARLDRFYSPIQSKLDINHTAYFIHGYMVGSDHSPVQIEVSIGSGEVRKTTYKWNVSHLKEFAGKMTEKWDSLPIEATFFQKLRHISRFYRQFSKQKAREYRKEELNARANLEVATAKLHDDIHNEVVQGEANMFKRILEEIETRKARGATVRARVKWQKVGDKCSAEFFRSVRQKNTQAVILELRDNQGRIFTKRKDLEQICLDFYQNLYRHKDICRVALREVLEDLPATFTDDMNASLSKEITVKEISAAILSMAKGKAPGHDGIPIEFFQHCGHSISKDYHKMILKSIEERTLHEGVTKGLISLIPKEGDSKDLNYWRPITLLTASYKIYAKTLQRRLQPILRDTISPEQTAFLPLRLSWIT
jgi:exonuclease III